MPNSTPPSKTTSDRSSDIFHITLLVLCAVGFLVLYFKVDLDGSLNASYIANVSQQVERVERRLLMMEKGGMEKIAHQKEIPAPQFQTSMESSPGFTRIRNTELGMTLTVPNSWGEVGEYSSGLFWRKSHPSDSLGLTSGAEFRIKFANTTNKICGATQDFSASRGGDYCDDYGYITEANGVFTMKSRFLDQQAKILQPTRVYNVMGGLVLLFSGAEAKAWQYDGPGGDYPNNFALIPLKGNAYKTAWIDFGDSSREEIEAVIRSIEVFTPNEDVAPGADAHKLRISELEKIQQKIQLKQPKAKYQLAVVEESLTVSSGDEVCINSGGSESLQSKGTCGFVITILPLDKIDRSYLPGEGMMTGEPTKYAEVIKRPGLEDGPGEVAEYTAHYGTTEYNISVFDSTEGLRTGVLDRDQVLDTVLQAFKK